MPRLVPDVLEGILEIGPAPGDWEEFEQGSILKSTKKTGEAEWRCQRCDCSYGSEAQSIEHLRSSPNHILCLQCPRLPEFSTMRNLYIHMNRRHSLCLVCGVFIRSVALYHTHVTDHPRCIMCQKQYIDDDDLLQHYFNHSDSLRIKCPYRECAFEAPYYTHIFEHLEGVTCGGRMHRFVLDNCYRTWSASTSQNFFDWRRQPTTMYGLVVSPKYRCTGCFAVQNCLSRLSEHIELYKCRRISEKHSSSLKIFWSSLCVVIRNFEEAQPME